MDLLRAHFWAIANKKHKSFSYFIEEFKKTRKGPWKNYHHTIDLICPVLLERSFKTKITSDMENMRF